MNLNLKPDDKSSREEMRINTQATDRKVEMYEKDLGINLSEMKGATVLDIGSGERENFSKEAKKYGITVISMSPDLKREENRKLLTSDGNWQRRSVAGLVQAMPFPTNTFDYEFAEYSAPYHIHFSDEVYPSFSEVVRTLKPGGKAYFFPIKIEEKRFIGIILKRISAEMDFEFIESSGLQTLYRLIITKK